MFGDSDDADIGQIRYENSDDSMGFVVNNSARLSIKSDGRVGIGTTSPGHTLAVRSGTANSAIANFTGATVGRGLVIATDNDGGVGDDTVIYNATESTGSHVFQVNASEKARIDTSGRLLVGTSSDYLGNTQAQLQLNHGSGPLVCLRREDAGVSDGNLIGGIRWLSSAGGVTEECARIRVEADGTQGSGDKPARMRFYTTADGASGPSERMRIDSNGFAKLCGNTGGIQSTNARHELRTARQSDIGIYNEATSTSYANAFHYINVARAASSSYSFYQAVSNNNSDTEFNLRGDGQAYADGSWNGGGADYAEYFEWSDGNTTAEDRRGISVVLDGDKIREAVAGEEPIGVISGNPSVVGDADIDRWKGKYLRDDFGTYIWEDYEVEDEDGNSVTQQRRKLNPAYDPDVEYVSREDRPEWDCVGLMGKLRIRKGQVTGARWIKMRDISDSVEEWLVR